MFDNLKNLSLGEWSLLDNFSPLVYFLLHSPQLEKLTLKLKVDHDVFYFLQITFFNVFRTYE
jgi:hypothetical protein